MACGAMFDGEETVKEGKQAAANRSAPLSARLCGSAHPTAEFSVTSPTSPSHEKQIVCSPALGKLEFLGSLNLHS